MTYEKNNLTKYEISHPESINERLIDEYFSGMDDIFLELKNHETLINDYGESPIHNEAYYLSFNEGKHPLEEEYDNLGDAFYPDAPNYRENLNGECLEIEYEHLLGNDPYYDIPKEALIEDDFYPDTEEEYEIPDYLDENWLLSEYKFIEKENRDFESILANDPYYDELNYELEDVAYVTDDQLYEDYVVDKFEYLFDDDFNDYEDYPEDDEFYFEDEVEKHPLEEEYDNLGDAFYPDAPNYRENLNGQYF